MNIRSVTIRNFRNFRDFTINFSSGFQTIIGENNIGKSNLYWAVRLVLDKDLSYNARNLDLKDFWGFRRRVSNSDYIVISIELFSEKLSKFPTFHALKTGDNTARITYLYAHKSAFTEGDEAPAEVEIDQFKWQLFASGNSLEISDILQLHTIRLGDLDGINLYYINAFRNINSDLHGSTKLLLSKYCQSRSEAKSELESMKSILKKSSDDLNELPFIPDISQNIQQKGYGIAGSYFSFPVTISFLSNYDEDAWSQLNLFYCPDGQNIPIQTLGLGQKNLLYLSLFIAELENTSNAYEINILLIEEPEAHLHPQLQKILFSRLNALMTTQIFMTSHSTHIASDCDHKNLNVLFRDHSNSVKSFWPLNEKILSPREISLLKRYLDATRSELFFASAVIFVEGMAEQFVIPAIAKEVFGINLSEHNISVIPIHSRFFDPYLKLMQSGHFEIPCVAIIDGDSEEVGEGQEITTSVLSAKKLEVKERVLVSSGRTTLETDLFPDLETNSAYLKACFKNLGHEKSYLNLMEYTALVVDDWQPELLKRIEQTAKKGRFAQELSLLIDRNFVVPPYIAEAIGFIAKCKKVSLRNAQPEAKESSA